MGGERKESGSCDTVSISPGVLLPIYLESSVLRLAVPSVPCPDSVFRGVEANPNSVSAHSILEQKNSILEK